MDRVIRSCAAVLLAVALAAAPAAGASGQAGAAFAADGALDDGGREGEGGALPAEGAEAATAGAAGEGVTLGELVAEAVERNPRLKAARLRWAQVIERYPQVTAYDDPVLSYTYAVEPVETRLGPQEGIFSLSQKIPFPGKLGLKGEVVVKEVEIARTNYEKEIRDVIVEVKKTYYELFYLDRAIELTRQNKEVLEHLSTLAAADYGGDATALNDVLKAQSQYAQAGYDLILLREMRSTEATRLNTLLDRDAEHPVGAIAEPPVRDFDFTLDELYRWALESEENRAAALEVRKEELEERLARYRYLPDFRIGLNYADIGDPVFPVGDGGRDAVAVTLGINIPIWFSKNDAAVKEAAIRRERARQEKLAVANETKSRVKEAFFKLTNSERLMELYGDSLLPQAARSLETAEAWYKAGEGSLSGLLETQSIWFNFQLAYYRAMADYLKSLAELERVTGRPLQ